jgi:hypothetical protein
LKSSKRYNPNFERDFRWYLKMRHKFNFDGVHTYLSKRDEEIVQWDKGELQERRLSMGYQWED